MTTTELTLIALLVGQSLAWLITDDHYRPSCDFESSLDQ